MGGAEEMGYGACRRLAYPNEPVKGMAYGTRGDQVRVMPRGPGTMLATVVS